MDSELMNQTLFKIANETLASFANETPERIGEQIAKALERAYLAGAENSGKKKSN